MIHRKHIKLISENTERNPTVSTVSLKVHITSVVMSFFQMCTQVNLKFFKAH